MTHDYAKRAKPAKAATARKKSAPPPPKKPLWPLFIVLLLVVGLGYGLYQLAGVRTDPLANQQALQQPAAKSETKASSEAPVEEKSGFSFYKLLPESEVVPEEVEAYKSTPKSAADYSNYLLQAGSFKSAADADSLRAQLLLAGMPNVTTSKVTSANGSVWYRVRIGPFASRSKLNKAYDQLVRMNLQPLRVKI
jgi:cell division protein FtsN